MSKDLLPTVIEMPNYWKKASKFLSEAQREEIVTIVACKPEIGDIVQGTGGLRKFRYAFQTNKGKSGGARVIHLPVPSKGKVYLMDIFAKNEKENLSKAERNQMASLVKILKGEGP